MSAALLEHYFPSMQVPDRPPDVQQYHYTNGPASYTMWYPTATESGFVFSDRSSSDYRITSTYTDSCYIDFFGTLGLRPVLDYVGIHAQLHKESVPSWAQTEVAAMEFPSAENFCARMNEILVAEASPDSPAFQYTVFDEQNPYYSTLALVRFLRNGLEPIAADPVVNRHDQTHALAAYLSLDVVRIQQSDAEALLNRGDIQPEESRGISFRHELAHDLSVLAEVLGYGGPGIAVYWSREFGDSTDDYLAQATSNLKQRLATTPARFATLGLAA